MCEIDRSSKSQIFLGDIETNFHDSLKLIFVEMLKLIFRKHWRKKSSQNLKLILMRYVAEGRLWEW